MYYRLTQFIFHTITNWSLLLQLRRLFHNAVDTNKLKSYKMSPYPFKFRMFMKHVALDIKINGALQTFAAFNGPAFASNFLHKIFLITSMQRQTNCMEIHLL